MGLEIVGGKDGTVAVSYDLRWVYDVMTASGRSMVPFSWFSEGGQGRIEHRSYPRSTESTFTLGELQTKDAKSGGRPHSETFDASALTYLLACKSAIPLSDVAILTKRALCIEARKTKLAELILRGGALEKELVPEVGAYGYPMLCILGKSSDSDKFPKNQSQWRLTQALFCAELTAQIRNRKIGLEVVSREGFGSLFPTMADLPGGIRLDSGLLPPVKGSAAVVAALKVLDDFVGAVRKKSPKWLTSPPNWLGDLGGFSDDALDAVDRLTSFLHSERSQGGTCDYSKSLDKFNGTAVTKCLDEMEDLDKAEVVFEVDTDGQLEDYTKAKKFKRRTLLLRDHKKLQSDEVDMSGYGSESDYEEEEDEEQVLERPVQLGFAKYSVATGMAALRMAVRYGAEYSAMLHQSVGWKGGGEYKRVSGLTTWAPYFELDHSELVKSVKCGPQDISLLVFDGAPNPINVPEDAPSVKKRQWGTIVIDTTNNTSKEKAKYVLSTRLLLAQLEHTSKAGGLLIMVDSASKHPTGGDLVHGVIRAYGAMPALVQFHKKLTKHLKGGEYAAIGQTLLKEPETSARKRMLESRLLTRNLDVVRLVSALQTQ